jgi:hypothetical protein
MTRNRNRLCCSAPAATAVVPRRARISFSGWAGLGRLAGLAGLVASLGLAGLTATPAGAEVFHVKLHNGTIIDTLYQPQQATFDPNVVILLSDAGNWIGINQREIESVLPDSEIHGFGVALNFNTIAIGWAPNDAPEPTAPSAQSATQQALQNLYRQQQQEQHYTIPQFVNTDQTAGIPARLVGGAVLPGMPAPVTQLPVPLPAGPAQAPGGGAANQQ